MISVVALALLQLAMPARTAVAPVSDDAQVAMAATDSPKFSTGNVDAEGLSAVSAPSSAPSGAPDQADQATGSNQASATTHATDDAPIALVASAGVNDVSEDSSASTAALMVRPLLALDAASAPESSPAAETFSSSLAPAAAPIISTAQQAQEAENLHNWQEHQKKIWLALSIAQSSAAGFDAYSTRLVVGSGRGYEMNPMLRPFAGNASMYLAIQAGPVLIDYISRRMLESHHSWMRRGWWVPQVTGTVVSLFSGARNTAIYASGQ